MMLAFFKFGLPVLLGYVLFVGISGRLNPFVFPDHKEERASWLLGAWTGLVVSIILGFGLSAAHGHNLSNAATVLKLTAGLLALLLIPALALYGYYEAGKAKLSRMKSSFDWALSEDDVSPELTEQEDIGAFQPQSAHPEHDARASADAQLKVSPAYLETVRIDQMHNASHAEAVNDASDSMDASDLENVPPTQRSTQSEQTTEIQPLTPAESKDTAVAQENSQIADTKHKEKLIAEIALRKETEQHLRITRKALSVLEADTRQQSIGKADAVIELEEKLAQSITQATDRELDAMHEKARRMEAEQDVVELKQRMVKAKQDVRRSAAARAKALSTANQSIAFARQSVQIRTRLESELEDAKATINNRQKTISSLIRALEKEKRHTQKEINSMAKQLVLHEKQLQARRSLEEVARSVENKLATRLVKKVAKARPIIPDMNQGEAS